MRIDVNELPEEMAKLVQKAWFAREVVITRDGQPWVKLVPTTLIGQRRGRAY